jgi:hypothetical protein
MVLKLKSPIIFLPLLLLYCIVTLGFTSDSLVADEGRYLKYAKNLSQGYYSPKDKISLRNGPGYPILLLPFVLLNTPLIIPKLLNPIFLFLAILYCFYSFKLYSENNNLIIFCSYIIGLYPPILKWLPYLMPEVFAYFLVCGFIYHFCLFHYKSYFSWSNFLISILFLGFLALTKIIFGYVILVGICIFLILYFLTKNKSIFKSSIVLFFALILCIPYLAYTYSLTGKIFYWGTNGGEKLYWMSTLYANEYGDWFTYEETVHGKDEFDRNFTGNLTELANNHAGFYKKMTLLPGIEKDTLFRKKAMENIKAHPVKYLKNWMASIGRYFFNFPFSYTSQKLSTYFYLLPNMFLFVICFLCIYPSYLCLKWMQFEILALLIISAIYSGGSTLVNAQARHFTPLVPILILWIVFTYNNLIKIQIKKDFS